MPSFAIAQLFNCCLLVTMGLFTVAWYRRKVGYRSEVQSLQYGMCAIRDRVIRLVAEGHVSEEDAEWQRLYRQVNMSANWFLVVKFKTMGWNLVIRLLRDVEPPSSSDIKRFKTLPPELQLIWRDYVRTVLSVLWDGSFLFRTGVHIATRFAGLRQWVKRLKPVESARYTGWQFAESSISPSASSSSASASSF
ncbi:MAG: hypothetical protein ABIP48_27340 [Planctomycetota bacterium]